MTRDVRGRVETVLRRQPVFDMHTHCYAPSFGDSADGTGRGLLHWGIDELVTYHYLVAEVFRVVPATELPYDRFWAMPTRARADHIWTQLFVKRTPLSEACRGVLTTLSELGLDPNEKSLDGYRRWFAAQRADAYVDRIMELANVARITMTNEVFNDQERAVWLSRPEVGRDPRFATVLRIDPLLRNWPAAAARLRDWGYEVTLELTQRAIEETARFLRDWIDRMQVIYVATSLPPTFRYPDVSNPTGDAFIERVLVPVLAERGLPWALMIGRRIGVNPSLREAGDTVGQADVASLINLCHAFPANRFLVTLLSRENQHELCVAARKFGNLMPFGCWWYLNNPSIIGEMTRERLELLGTSFVPQHSDARVLDQLIYKWAHSRSLIAAALAEKYALLEQSGYRVTAEQMNRDARLLLHDNFVTFSGVAVGPAAV